MSLLSSCHNRRCCAVSNTFFPSKTPSLLLFVKLFYFAVVLQQLQIGQTFATATVVASLLTSLHEPRHNSISVQGEREPEASSTTLVGRARPEETALLDVEQRENEISVDDDDDYELDEILKAFLSLNTSLQYQFIHEIEELGRQHVLLDKTFILTNIQIKRRREIKSGQESKERALNRHTGADKQTLTSSASVDISDSSFESQKTNETQSRRSVYVPGIDSLATFATSRTVLKQQEMEETISSNEKPSKSFLSRLIRRGGKNQRDRQAGRGKEAVLATSTDEQTSAEEEVISSFRGERWMEDYKDKIYPLTLRDMVFPGAHDAGAYLLSDKIVVGAVPKALVKVLDIAKKLGYKCSRCIIRAWGVAQSMPLKEQLNAGIRYFDIRAAWDKEENVWKTYHGLYGVTLQTLFSDISQFIRKHKGEVVVLEIGHFAGDPSTENKLALAKLIVETLGKDVLAPYQLHRAYFFRDSTTIAKLVESNHRVLVGVDFWTDLKDAVGISNLNSTGDKKVERQTLGSFTQALEEKSMTGINAVAANLRKDSSKPNSTAGEQQAKSMAEKGNSSEEEYFLWPTNILFKNTYANSCDIKTMIAFNHQQSKLYRESFVGDSHLFKISWTLTPDTKCILKGLFDIRKKHPRSLLQLADTANKRKELQQFILNEQQEAAEKGAVKENGKGTTEVAAMLPASVTQAAKNTGKHNAVGNIILVDHFETSRVVPLIIEMLVGSAPSSSLPVADKDAAQPLSLN